MSVAAAVAREARSGGAGTLLAGGWGLAIAAYVGVAAWVAAHPAALSSDDALFLSRGLTRFSILDFSPQFPGYPGFIAMGRLVLLFARSPVEALAFLTELIAFAIPPAAALVAWRSGGSAASALAAFALTLSQPLMPDLALSLLTDGAGILFLLVFLALLLGGDKPVSRLRALLAGAALGWALACRPSDAVLFAGTGLGAVFAAPRIVVPALAGGLAVVMPVAAVMGALEGGLYLDEGLRFFTGHALIWGNTAFGNGVHQSWISALSTVPAGVGLAVLLIAGVAAVLFRVRQASPALAAAAVAFATYAVWVISFQNPDQLRHLAPLAVLGGMLLASLPTLYGHRAYAAAALGLVLNTWVLFATIELDPSALPPLGRVADALSTEPAGSALATNAGVAVLRAALPHVQVYDAWYAADAKLGLATATGSAFRLTMTPLAGRDAAVLFPGRFAGEPSLWLYRER